MTTQLLAAIVAAAVLLAPFTVQGGEKDDPIFSDRFESRGPLTCPEDDPFEPNDDLESAAPITPGTTIEAIVCSGNDDFFIFSANEGDSLRILATFSHAEGDLDIKLFREGEPLPLASSSSTSDNESILYTVPAGEGDNYIVRVYGFGAASNTYNLEITITSDGSP